MARDLANRTRPRLDYGDFVRGAQVWPISPLVMADAVDAVHNLVRDEKADPKAKVNAFKALLDLGRLNLDAVRLRMEIDDRLGHRHEERVRAESLDHDLKALGWEGGEDDEGDDD